MQLATLHGWSSSKVPIYEGLRSHVSLGLVSLHSQQSSTCLGLMVVSAKCMRRHLRRFDNICVRASGFSSVSGFQSRAWCHWSSFCHKFCELVSACRYEHSLNLFLGTGYLANCFVNQLFDWHYGSPDTVYFWTCCSGLSFAAYWYMGSSRARWQESRLGQVGAGSDSNGLLWLLHSVYRCVSIRVLQIHDNYLPGRARAANLNMCRTGMLLNRRRSLIDSSEEQNNCPWTHYLRHLYTCDEHPQYIHD